MSSSEVAMVTEGVQRAHGEVVITPADFGSYSHGRHHFGLLRVDLTNTCNVHCGYCPNRHTRTKDKIDLEEFRTFLSERVIGLRELVLGCTQEPTLHPQLGEFIAAIANARVTPRKGVSLVTNGTLLHRHDLGTLHRFGVRNLYLSIDSRRQATLDLVRPGTKVEVVEQNVRALLSQCPRIKLHINVVVTNVNLPEIEELIEWGLALGCEHFVLREVFVPDGSPDAARVAREQLLGAGDFAALERRVLRRFAGRVPLTFADRHSLADKHYRRSPWPTLYRRVARLARRVGVALERTKPRR